MVSPMIKLEDNQSNQKWLIMVNEIIPFLGACTTFTNQGYFSEPCFGEAGMGFWSLLGHGSVSCWVRNTLHRVCQVF